jgi:hypothetical protein
VAVVEGYLSSVVRVPADCSWYAKHASNCLDSHGCYRQANRLVSRPEDRYVLFNAYGRPSSSRRQSRPVKINTPRGLDVLPVGTVISDNGCLAAKTPTGTWVYGDGQTSEPDLPVYLVGIPEH